MADSSSMMNKVVCDISTDSICNNISDNNNNNHNLDAAEHILISNEFYDDAHTMYNMSMHFAASTLQGYTHTPQGYVPANAFVSDRTHSMAVKVSNAL